MFDERHNIESDLMMRSILEGAQEEVPAHIWEGVSAGLDKAARRKTIVLWWRRAAVGAAAAAAVAAGVLLYDGQPELTPDASDDSFIAVVEPVEPTETEPLDEYSIEKGTVPVTVQKQAAAVRASGLTAYVPEETAKDTYTETVVHTPAEEVKAEDSTYDVDLSEDWAEEAPERHKVKTSLVLSGITGTNNVQSVTNPDRFKAPTLNPGPAKTGVKETSTNSSYGIPVSFGAGLKFELSPKWSLGVGANYSLLTRKFFGTYTDVNEDGAVLNSISADIRNTQHYVGIPVNAYYNIVDSRNINLYAYAGGAAEKCIADNYEVLNTSIVHKQKAKGVQMSANLGIGVEFMLGQHLGLYIDPSLRYYFDCGQPRSIRTEQPLMMGFEMGLRVNL